MLSDFGCELEFLGFTDRWLKGLIVRRTEIALFRGLWQIILSRGGFYYPCLFYLLWETVVVRRRVRAGEVCWYGPRVLLDFLKNLCGLILNLKAYLVFLIATFTSYFPAVKHNCHTLALRGLSGHESIRSWCHSHRASNFYPQRHSVYPRHVARSLTI